ncbi:MAG: BPSS1780 family membrane protein [Burkholderiales bacterium]
MAEINPYQAPQASLDDPGAADGTLAAEPRHVDAGRGLAWLAEGWTLFRQAPLPWIGITLIGIVIFMVLAFVPILGQLGSSLLSIVFGGGIMLGCRALDRGGELTVGHLFTGFQTHLSPLLVIGALYLGAVFGLGLIFALVGGGAAFSTLWGGADPSAAAGSVALAGLVFLLLLIPLAMAVWFAPALATLHNVAPVAAMKSSFTGCLRNLLPFLVYGVLLLILAILASIPFGLGWLVVLPMIAGSIYSGYKDIFLQR